MDTNIILDTGNTAWMIVATLLVLLMTIPGIALFYGGLVRQKNVLSIIMQCMLIVCPSLSYGSPLVTVLFLEQI